MSKYLKDINQDNMLYKACSFYLSFVIYKEYMFSYSDDQNIHLKYIWPSFLISGSQLQELLEFPVLRVKKEKCLLLC